MQRVKTIDEQFSQKVDVCIAQGTPMHEVLNMSRFVGERVESCMCQQQRTRSIVHVCKLR